MSQKITFAHLADLHLGGWREKTLTDLNFQTFCKSIDKVIENNVDFCLFSGDIFNNAMPPIELVQKVVSQFLRLKEKDIPLYIIGGSHDYSSTGKSFLGLLETTGVFIDVNKVTYKDKDKIELIITENKNLNVRICGVVGKKNGLDKNIYLNLDKISLSDNYFNIFMFHTTLNDFKPDFMKAVDVEVDSTFLPSGFNYYAGGHVHTYIEGNYGGGVLTYPGPLFPNSFSELKREIPSFNIVNFDFETKKIDINRVFVKDYDIESIEIVINNENPIEAREKIHEKLNSLKDINNKIILLEISGIVEGKVSEIGISNLAYMLYEKGALQVLKNTYKLTSAQVQVNLDNVAKEDEDIEKIITEEFLSDSNEKVMEADAVRKLLSLDLSKTEGEKVYQYEQKVCEIMEKSLNTLKY